MRLLLFYLGSVPDHPKVVAQTGGEFIVRHLSHCRQIAGDHMSLSKLPRPVNEMTTERPTNSALSRAFSRREMWIGGSGLAIGLTAGAVGALLVGLLASDTLVLMKSQPMTDAAKACDVTANNWITVGDGGQSISMKSSGEEDDGADFSDINCVLVELQITDSVRSRINATRALDGRQSASWPGQSASWGYHPDHGLDIVIEVAQK